LRHKVAFLRRAASYPEGASRVEVKETHMSWVFLTERLVYKMKKPVTFAYLDFSTLEARRHFCLESLRLNRRLAADVYLEVLPLTRDSGGRLQLGGAGEPVEWLEKMLRLPEARMLDRVILTGHDVAAQAAPAARLMAEFYRARPALAVDPDEHRRSLAAAVRDNVQALLAPEYNLGHDNVQRLERAMSRTLTAYQDLFAQRIDAGHVVEGHGDLRPEHVCLIDPPVVIDCLEFDRQLRIVDAADELAYLALECERLGADLHQVLFDAYRQATGDSPPDVVVRFYKVHRAMLRAKLAVWHLADHDDHDKWIGQAHAYLSLALAHARGL